MGNEDKRIVRDATSEPTEEHAKREIYVRHK